VLLETVEEQHAMAQAKRKNRHERRREAHYERRGKSPAEFCATYGISRSTYEEWQRRGIGPAVLQPIPGGRVIITDQAEADWLAKRTAFAAVAVADATG
jgi:hypothetical protein